MFWRYTSKLTVWLAAALMGCAAPATLAVQDAHCPDPAPRASNDAPPPETDTPKPAATRLILVRHAEKVDASADAALSPEGHARAAALATALADAEVSAIYSSDYQRTRDTVAPLAAATGLEIQLYDPAEAAVLAGPLVARHAGQTVLVVGHSPSVPAMINALVGEERVSRLERYDQLFVVVADEDGAALLVMRYGE